MNTGDWLAVAAIAVLLCISIVIAVAETSFLRMNRIRALAWEEEGRKGAARLAKMLERPEQTVNVVKLVALAAQIVSAQLVGVLATRFLGGWGLGLGIALNIVGFFVLAEAVPSTYAVQQTDRAATQVSGLLWVLTHFAPLRLLARGLIGLANVIVKGEGLARGPFVTEAEIRAMADVAAGEAEIEKEERELIHSIFEFGDTVVREVMRPRTDMIAVEADATVDEAIGIAISAGFSRLPAYDDTTDNIVGLVYLRDLAARGAAGAGSEPVRHSLRRAVFVPESKRVADLLREMQTQKFHMAIVIDEYGGTAGIVTLEDLLEEIVGEITDEYDVEEPHVERLPDGTFRVPGRTPIDEVNEELGVALPDVEWDTVAGLVFNTLGHVPIEGETVRCAGLEFAAEHVEGHRIVSVLIRPDLSTDGLASPGDAGDPAAVEVRRND